MTIVFASVAICLSIILFAYLIRRARCDSVVRSTLRFIGGPFPLSIALHAFLLLFLIITMHESRARELTLLTLEAGGGGGGEEMRELDLDTQPMPEIERASFPQPVSSDASAIATSADNYVRNLSLGIGAIGGGGIGTGYGPGIGSGFGGYLGDLRRKGLDVVLVIDGTGSMSLVIQDVKARMRELVAGIHRLVPTARIGVVVYGGKGEAIQSQPLTLSPLKLEGFLGSIGASGGDEWEENVRGGVTTAIDKMDWRTYAKKVIVLVADTPPSKEDFAPTREMIQSFRTRNGTFNAVDLSRLEHERFQQAFNEKVHRDLTQTKSEGGALPQFYRETQLAYQVLTRDGGGATHTLDSNEQINQQVMLLAFGDQWRDMIAAFTRSLASK